MRTMLRGQFQRCAHPAARAAVRAGDGRRPVRRRAAGAICAGHDESAFEALIARHGPMVLGVCRQLLRDPNDVDDAFQATFLVLVRKAGTLRRRDLLGNWLYGVAHRVATRARVLAAQADGEGPVRSGHARPARCERAADRPRSAMRPPACDPGTEALAA